MTTNHWEPHWSVFARADRASHPAIADATDFLSGRWFCIPGRVPNGRRHVPIRV